MSTMAEPLTGIRACLFDVYGTLFDVHAPVSSRLIRVGDPAVERALSDTWRRKQLEYTWLRTVMGEHVDFWTITGQALDYAMASVGLNDKVLRAKLMEAYLALPPFPDTRPVIEALSAAGMPLGILSNGTPVMLSAVLATAGLTGHFSQVLSVESVGAFKPAREVYALGPEVLGMAPHEIAFVSSNGWDIAGAAHFGYSAVWINRGDLPADGLPGAPKAVLGGLSQLPALLGKA